MHWSSSSGWGFYSQVPYCLLWGHWRLLSLKSLILIRAHDSVSYMRKRRERLSFTSSLGLVWVSSLNVALCFRFLCVCWYEVFWHGFMFWPDINWDILISLCFVCASVCLTCRLFYMTLRQWRRHFGRSWSWCDVFLRGMSDVLSL